MPTSLAEALDTAMDKAVAEHKTDLAKPAPAPEVKAEAEPAKPVETPPDKPAPAPETPAPAQPDKAKEQPPDNEGSDESQLLLTKEDRAEIQKNPLLAKAYKLMQGDYTRKTMELAEKRKGFESYEPLIESWKKDPQGTARILAQQAGLELAPAKAAQEPAKQDTLAILKESLGPDLSFLADQLAPAIEKIVAARTGESVAPLKQFQETLVAETAAKETAAVMEAFTKAHPDYAKHEPKMVQLIGQLEPKGDMSQRDYLEMIWHLATKDVQEAESIKQVVQKINEAASKAESPSGAVAAERVAKAPPKFVNLNDAIDKSMEAARRGERWEAEA